MNPIVFALRRPYTVMVMVVALVLGGIFAAGRMSIDVFPNLNLPIIYVCQPYGGMDPAQMEGLLTNYYEYHFLYIGGIHHVESRNVQGMALMKLYFHPGTNMAQAMAETIGYVTRSRAFMPPGTVSPFITRFDAGSIPVGYLVMSSETRSIAEIQDQSLFKVRPMFAGLPGVSAPPPFGGSQRTLVARVDPDKLRSYNMSPDEVMKALDVGNTISPSGNVRIGDLMPIVPVNSLVKQAKDLETIPIRLGAEPTVYLRDVATVQDASDVPVGYALVNGRRAVYILVTKRADASTLSVVRNVKNALPKMQAVLPEDIKVSFEFDQSPTVTNAVRSLVFEGVLGAALTGLMVLVFLRDWRSVIVVVLNIPLAIAGAVAALWLTGQSINLMTLGGLALAVGILVDEATVEIENIHHKLEEIDSVSLAVRRGNLDTAVPRLLAMLCILAVFLPSFFMQGAAQALFVPMSLAVGFSMIASYLLSSTFVPVLSAWLLKSRHGRVARRTMFDRIRDAYGAVLAFLMRLRWILAPTAIGGAAAFVALIGPRLGLEIFPKANADRFQMRIKAPTGTRFETTERLAVAALAAIREEAGSDAVEISIGYVGNIPSTYPINAIYQWTGGPEEAMLRVAFRPGSGVSIERLEEKLRSRLAGDLPGVRFAFEPADIVSEVMSFGSPTPIEVAVDGPALAENRAYVEKIKVELEKIRSLRDVQFVQALDYPTLNVEIDREVAGLSGVGVAEIARSLVAATSSSRFVLPNYWPDPKTGIGYQVQIEIPFQAMNSVGQIESIPIQRSGAPALLLRDVAKVTPGVMPGEFDRYNMKRVVSLTANIAGGDLGAAASEIRAAIRRVGDPPKGSTLELRGQIPPLDDIVSGLTLGLILAVVVILLLLTANFQSLGLALAVVATTPAVVAGVVAMLWLTRTTVNIESYLGAIMSIGVSTANAILLIAFAERVRRTDGSTAAHAAVEGAKGRLRPILMTGAAMIAGMLPMALGLTEGGEQTAPLGRAVIGGLIAATFATLFVLPLIFALIRGGAGKGSASLDPFDPESVRYVGDQHNDEDEMNNRAADRSGLARAGSSVLGAILILGLVGCDRLAAPTSGSAAPAPSAAAAVEVETPRREKVRNLVQVPAQIEAAETAPIYAKVSGYVSEITVDIGSSVKKGQVLARLSAPEILADLEQKTSAVGQARARVVQGKAGVTLANATVAGAEAKVGEVGADVRKADADVNRRRLEFNRTKQLADDKAVTQSALDESLGHLQASEAARDADLATVRSAEAALAEARAVLEKAEADLVAAQAGISLAEAEAKRARTMVEYLQIPAPFDGVVTKRNVDTGHLTAVGAQGAPLFVVARVDQVTVAAGVPEISARLVKPQNPASILPQGSAQPIPAKVDRVADALDPATRTLRVEMDLPKGPMPGAYAYVAITVQEHGDALTIPSTAVIRDSGKAFCMVVENGKAVRKPIEVGFVDGLRAEILNGLVGSETVVKANGAALANGQVVRVESVAPKVAK